ncbi:MAG: inositol monophosphatase family protein [Desulfobacteraceae bacterium]|jgi:myo-inositol-1(or 4)-monophosphatase
MDSSPSLWREILCEAADAVRLRVKGVLSKRGTCPVDEFKRLLDEAAQEALCDTFSRRAVSACLVSEEGEEIFGRGEVTITADPVDGTTNLARGLPPSVVSLSVAKRPRQEAVTCAVVSDLESGCTYSAERDRGATRNGLPIRVSECVGYGNGLVSMDVSKMEDLSPVSPLITGARHIRAQGCAAVSLCHVAEGTLDAHVDVRGSIRATDISAGLFILKQAGGAYSVDGRSGGDFSLKRDTRVSLVAASGPALLEEIVSLLAGSRRE